MTAYKTHAELNRMKMDELAKYFGVKRPRVGTTKQEFIDRALAATTEPVGDEAEETEKTPKKEKRAVVLPRVVVRTPDGPQIRWTPLGKGKWREENSATGDVREADGGHVADWDGTTLVLPNFHVDEWGHPTPFVPLIAPHSEEDEDAADDEG